MDPTHALQIKVLRKAVRVRINRLEQQQAALTQTLLELNEIEQLAMAALRNMETAPLGNTGAASTGRSL